MVKQVGIYLTVFMRGLVICKQTFERLSYETLHPGDKKQNVQFAYMLHQTTTAAISSYLPDREDATEFIRLINTWWNISNSKYKFDSHYRIKNAVVLGDKKNRFSSKNS